MSDAMHNAPAYLVAHDLAVWLAARRSETSTDPWQSSLLQHAAELVSSIALALTFPARRAQHLEAADEAIVRIRILLRLLRARHELSADGLRFAASQLALLGRMLGGWQKARSRRTTTRSKPGGGSPAAPPA